MAGIYIHIPFCRQACHYCDFHFSTNLSRQDDMIRAISKELTDRKDYLGNEEVQTIYFGGGTPSLLSESQLEVLFDTMLKNYHISPASEITLEANPEDLSEKYLSVIRELGINRLSLGVQTFSNDRLKWMNRIHNASQSKEAYALARESGFTNISLDLIYAVPEFGFEAWMKDLEQVVNLNPDHISLYGLTIEEKTVFGKWKNKGKLKEITEDEAAQQYLASIEYLEARGYLQYEVSNFSKDGYRSRHNASYWSGKKYLGIGPGAHSFDQLSRQYNLRNNAAYLKSLLSDETRIYFESEDLSRTQQMNERILTQLRTVEGVDLEAFEHSFDVRLDDEFAELLRGLQEGQLIKIDHQKFHLTPKGFLMADEIALNLFFNE